MSDKIKYPRALALATAHRLMTDLSAGCDRIVVAGSLRRCKEQVGDIEILYIPKTETRPDGLFDTLQFSLADEVLQVMLASRRIDKRKNVDGDTTWGPKNKYAVADGIPVDFFQTNALSWFNYLVCRTGPAESNTKIAKAAQLKGWQWHPYGEGFTDEEGNLVPVSSEEDVFRLVGLPYLEPKDR